MRTSFAASALRFGVAEEGKLVGREEGTNLTDEQDHPPPLHHPTTSLLRTPLTPVYKPGKVAVVLAGRQAGKKVVVVRQLDEGTKERPYPHAIVAGIERYPLKVTKSMGKKKVSRRSKVKPFIKVVNYAHLLPTRYVLELESLKGSISNDTFKEPSQREDAKKAIKKAFEERYAKGSNRWFFSKLKF